VQNDAGDVVQTSPDGITWTTSATPTGGQFMGFNKVIWVSSLSLFIGVGSGFDGANKDMFWSSDGKVWNFGSNSQLDSSGDVLAHSPSLGFAITIDDSGSFGNIFTSTDGKAWVDTGFNTGGSPIIPTALFWVESFGLFLLRSTGGGGRTFSSPDGTTYTQRSTLGGASRGAFAYSPTLDKAVMVTGSGADFAITSDGLTWTQTDAPFEGVFTDVCWSVELSLFITVAEGGAANLVATSPDGVTWTQRTTGFSEDWQAVACGALDLPARGTSMTHVELDALDSAFPEWTFLSANAANLNHPGPPGGSQCDHFAHDPREPRIYHVFPTSLTSFGILLTYAKMPTALTALVDTYPLGDEYFDAAVALVKHRMLEKDGRHGQGSDRREDAYNDFLRALGAKVNVETTVDPAQHRPPEDLHG